MTLVPFLVIIFRYSDNCIIVIYLNTQKQICILLAQRTQCSRYFRLTFKKQILNFFFWNSYDFSNINFSLDILVIFIPKFLYKANEYWIDRYLSFDWLLLKNASHSQRLFDTRKFIDQHRGCRREYWMIMAHPPPSPPPPRQYARPATHRKTEKEKRLADDGGRERGGRGAKSFDRKKAWPSINIQYSLSI